MPIRAGKGPVLLLVSGQAMKLWPVIPLLLFAGPASLSGQSVAELDRKGTEALADGLYEVAGAHFRQCLADRSLTPEVKSQVAIRLAEALVRSGNPGEALELLGQSFVAKDAAANFWKAQALAAQRRIPDAIGIFGGILKDESAPFPIESAFTKASLELELERPEDALQTLSSILPGAEAASSERIRIYQTEILLDLGRVKEARENFDVREPVLPSLKPLAAFLEARLLLAEGKAEEAEAGFEDLVALSQGRSLPRYQSAVVGLADAVQAQGDIERASALLLNVVQEDPDSQLLGAIFGRLLEWLPEKPTLTDPVLERVGKWITAAVLPTPPLLIGSGSPANGGAAASAWPVAGENPDTSDLLAWSLYTRAIGLHRLGTLESKNQATGLLYRLRMEFPKHALASRALFQQARWLLTEGRTDQAGAILAALRETSRTGLKGEAAFLEARASSLNGNFQDAAKLFDEAASTMTGEGVREARLQAAIARLQGGVPGGVVLIQQTGAPVDKVLEADVELEKALSTKPPSAARASIEEFLTRFPDHPRVAEARLAAAEVALAGPPPDLSFARAQLDTLATTPEKLAALPPARVAMIRLRIADLSHDAQTAIAEAQSIISTFPDTPAALEASLTLGRNLYQSGDYNPARLVFEKLARAAGADANRSQPAWLMAARSAALGGTPTSKEEARILFDEAIKANGPVTTIAILEKARHLIDMSQLKEASDFLSKWIQKWPDDDPLQLPAGLLLGEALYAQGSSSNASSLEQALAVYDRLLGDAKKHPALFNRLQFLRGNTLANLPDPKDPAKTREREAFQAYYSVLETDTPPAEWEFFEECGFKAVTLLEKEGRAKAAIAVAKKIASFKGPRAEEANARASKIHLEQQVWEED